MRENPHIQETEPGRPLWNRRNRHVQPNVTAKLARMNRKGLNWSAEPSGSL